MSEQLLDEYREANPGMTAGEEVEVPLEPYAGQLGWLNMLLKSDTNGALQLAMFEYMAVEFKYGQSTVGTVQIVFHRNGKWHVSDPTLWGMDEMKTMVLVNELKAM